METITEAVARQARDRPTATALVCGGIRLGWREVGAWVEQAAGWLAALGLPRGAPILGWLPNCLEWYLLRLACERSGLLWIPVPTSQGKREFAAIIDDVCPAVLVTKAHFRNRDFTAEVDEICSRRGHEPVRVTIPDQGVLLLDGPAVAEDIALRLDEMAHALSTSGSEGSPKLALYTLAAACERGHAQAGLLRLTGEDIILVLSSGTGPARPAWLAAPVAGSCVVAMPVFEAGAALNLIQREGATVVCGTPSQLGMLAAKLESADTSCVRIWYSAGSVLPPALAEDLEAGTRGIVVSGYGGADFGGWAAPDLEDPPAVRHCTVGKPRGGTEFRIVDPDGHDVRRGQVGELIGRGPCCVSGFLGEEGRDRWRDGWFHTGDLASLDDSGNLVIVGRLREVIIRGGDKVNPTEVEALLRTHREIAQVAVIGVSDPVLGERICACVVPSKHGSAIDLAAVRQYLRSQGLAHYKTPEQLVILDSLPAVGDKVDRRGLAALLRKSQTRETAFGLPGARTNLGSA
jgi:acyl-CoA synthetase (AMP-forming)/AMP-acid ligase II